MALAIFQEESDKRALTFGSSDGNLPDSERGTPIASHSIRRTDCSRVTNPCRGWSARMSENISRTVSGVRGFGGTGAANGSAAGDEGRGMGFGISEIPTGAPDANASAASAAGIANIAPTETPTAKATVAAFFWIRRERRSQSTVKNAPVPAIQARTAAIQPATANAHEDAATALHAMSAKPTAIRTFAVFFQISRRRSVLERTGSPSVSEE